MKNALLIMSTAIIIALCAGCAKGTDPISQTADIIIPDLNTPESFYYDADSDACFISNINGEPKGMDNNGYITRLDGQGRVLEKSFIAGGKKGVKLNAPKGMVVLNKKLYVTDIVFIHSFNLPAGTPDKSINLSRMDAKFLNDITALNGQLYITDTFGSRIFTVNPALTKAELVMQIKDTPNGIIAVPDSNLLCVVTWGPGKVLHIDPVKKERILFFDGFKEKLRNLDGIVFDAKGNMIFSSYSAGAIYMLTPEKALTTLHTGLTTPADIGINQHGSLLVPFIKADTAGILPRTIDKQN